MDISLEPNGSMLRNPMGSMDIAIDAFTNLVICMATRYFTWDFLSTRKNSRKELELHHLVHCPPPLTCDLKQIAESLGTKGSLSVNFPSWFLWESESLACISNVK